MLGSSPRTTKGELNRLVRRLEQHIDRLDKEIERYVGKDPQLRRRAEILTSIGRITAYVLVPGLKVTFSRKYAMRSPVAHLNPL